MPCRNWWWWPIRVIIAFKYLNIVVDSCEHGVVKAAVIRDSKIPKVWQWIVREPCTCSMVGMQSCRIVLAFSSSLFMALSFGNGRNSYLSIVSLSVLVVVV